MSTMLCIAVHNASSSLNLNNRSRGFCHGKCYGLNVCNLQNSCVEIWTLKTRVWEDRLPQWFSKWRICLQCRRYRRCRFNPWVRQIPWRKAWQPTSVFLAGKFHAQWINRLRSMGSQGVRQDWSGWVHRHTKETLGNSLSTFAMW